MAAKCSDCGCYVKPYTDRCRSCEDAHAVTPEEVAETMRWCALGDRPFLRMEVERLAREGAVLSLNPTLQEEADHNMMEMG